MVVILPLSASRMRTSRGDPAGRPYHFRGMGGEFKGRRGDHRRDACGRRFPGPSLK
jgi:hypothetical protein